MRIDLIWNKITLIAFNANLKVPILNGLNWNGPSKSCGWVVDITLRRQEDSIQSARYIASWRPQSTYQLSPIGAMLAWPQFWSTMFHSRLNTQFCLKVWISKAESARYIASWRSQSSYQLPPIEILPKSLI